MSSQAYAERFLHPEDRPIVALEVRRAIETTDPEYAKRIEHRIVFPDGQTGYVSVAIVIVKDERGRTIRTYGVNQDITERVRAKQELERAHEQLRVLHENVEDALFSIDLVREKSLYASPGHERVFGYPAQAFVEHAMLWYELIVPEDKPLADAAHLALWRGESVRQQLRIARRDGEVRWIELRMKPTVDADGRPSRIDAIATDVTDRVREHEKRLTLETQLRQAQRVESLGTLAGGIAHDFNNILGIIVGYVSLIEGSNGDPGVLGRAIGAISRATARGSALVSQLLTFAGNTEVESEQVQLNDVVQELSKMLEQTFPKSITTRLELDARLPSVHGSGTQLHQLLLNLCINARDAMPAGGILSISTSVVSGEVVRARFPNASAAEYVRVCVRDTGTGMSEETRQRIFEPFFTTKSVGRGTGLGLSVALGIVEGHRGLIAVDSEVGRGTVFTIYLRLSDERPAPPSRLEAARALVPGGTETLLVIEDEELLRSLLKSVLEARGYVVLTADDGPHGLELFEAHKGEIDAVISDLGLPELSGVDVLERVRTGDPRVKRLIMSGLLTPDVAATLRCAGVSGIIAKPFQPSDVLRVVRAALDGRAAA